MNLEISALYLENYEEKPADLVDFVAPLIVEIGEQGKIGAEMFHFVAASALGLKNDVRNADFHFLRGHILMEQFDWEVIRRALQNLVNHANSKRDWNEIVEFFSRYGIYDSEDLTSE